MKAGQDLFDVTATVLLTMRDVLRDHLPDALLVHGDTSTTLAAAMAGPFVGMYRWAMSRRVCEPITCAHPSRKSSIAKLSASSRDGILHRRV